MSRLVLGLIGRDVSKSDSGKIHTFILSEWGIDCIYKSISSDEEDFERDVKRLLGETDGFNVTIPYKKSVIPYLRGVYGDAAAFDAVNTVLCASRGGYNTDGAGFLHMLAKNGVCVKGKKAVILGAGGAGRSTAATLKNAGAEVFLYQRRQRLLKDISAELGVNALDKTEGIVCDLLINCTGIGMHESEGSSPVGAETIGGCETAVDLIYRPAQSEFLRIAKSLGKSTVNGAAMLFYQAYYSDCLYTGRAKDEKEADRLYEKYLAAEGEQTAAKKE